jgi:hypothetical protein
MSNNQNLGIRIGAAGHFASRMIAAAVASGQVTYADASKAFADLTADCFETLNTIEDSYSTPAATQAAVAGNTAAVQELHAMTQNSGNTIVAPAPTVVAGSMPQVVGEQHGELPAWLGPICAKYGITKVFDNRPGLVDKPTRPHFRQAGLPAGSRDAKGLWPDTK